MSSLPQRAYRFGMWGLVALGLPGLFAAFLGARRIIPLPLGIAGGFTFFACALLGALVIRMIENGIFKMHLNQEYSQIIVGSAIIIAVSIDRVSEYLRAKRLARAK